MFDTYITDQDITCPICDKNLKEWQGYDGPCGLFVWKENKVSPVDQRAGESNISEAARSSFKLPKEFVIHSCECKCTIAAEANCKTKNSKWVVTELVTSSNAIQKKHERKSEYNTRLKWLKQKET